MMVCPDCKSEMSKKWQPRSAGEVVSSGPVWSCGVCGSQLTLADMKAFTQTERKVESEPLSSLLTLPRPLSELTAWAPTDAKRNRG